MVDRPIIKRAEALRRGLKRYFEGDVCRNGHRAERYVSSSNCCGCVYARVQAQRGILNGREPTHHIPPPEPPRHSPPNALPGIPLARLMAGK